MATAKKAAPKKSPAGKPTEGADEADAQTTEASETIAPEKVEPAAAVGENAGADAGAATDENAAVSDSMVGDESDPAVELTENEKIENDSKAAPKEPAPDDEFPMVIRTRTKKGADTYWRGGKQHGKEFKDWPVGSFTVAQAEKIHSDPNLVSEAVHRED